MLMRDVLMHTYLVIFFPLFNIIIIIVIFDISVALKYTRSSRTYWFIFLRRFRQEVDSTLVGNHSFAHDQI